MSHFPQGNRAEIKWKHKATQRGDATSCYSANSIRASRRRATRVKKPSETRTPASDRGEAAWESPPAQGRRVSLAPLFASRELTDFRAVSRSSLHVLGLRNQRAPCPQTSFRVQPASIVRLDSDRPLGLPLSKAPLPPVSAGGRYQYRAWAGEHLGVGR